MPLSATEKKELENLIKAIAANEEKTISTLISLPGDLLVEYSEQSAEFSRLCQTNVKVQFVWKDFLKKRMYPFFDITGLDKTHLSLFKQVLGAFLFWHYQAKSDLALLNKACQLGLYHALNERLAHYLQTFRELEVESSPDLETFGELKAASGEDKEYLDQMDKDADQLANLYWAPGCLTASEYMLAIANDYKQLKNILARKYYLKSLEFLVTAQLLENDLNSKRLIDVIYQGKGLIAGHYNKFKSWSDAIESVMKEGELSFDDLKEITNIVKEKLVKLEIPFEDNNRNNFTKT